MDTFTFRVHLVSNTKTVKLLMSPMGAPSLRECTFISERISSYMFMRPMNQPAPPGFSSTPERFMTHASFIVGERVIRPGIDPSGESGYQVLRLSTELVPATLALLGTEQVSPFWAVLFYFILILFGIAQQVCNIDTASGILTTY